MVKAGSKVIGYVRVSTREQGGSGLGLDAQRHAIEQECARRGWVLERIYEDVATGANGDRRGLDAAKAALASGLVAGLVVSKLDRLSRSVRDVAELVDTAQVQGWGLVALDVGMDTSLPSGRLLANMLATVAQWERDVISQRTRDALAETRARGTRLGRPSGVPADVLARIRRERERGASLRAIADALNADDVPRPHGGRQWYASTVRGLLGE